MSVAKGPIMEQAAKSHVSMWVLTESGFSTGLKLKAILFSCCISQSGRILSWTGKTQGRGGGAKARQKSERALVRVR